MKIAKDVGEARAGQGAVGVAGVALVLLRLTLVVDVEAATAGGGAARLGARGDVVEGILAAAQVGAAAIRVGREARRRLAVDKYATGPRRRRDVVRLVRKLGEIFERRSGVWHRNGTRVGGAGRIEVSTGT